MRPSPHSSPLRPRYANSAASARYAFLVFWLSWNRAKSSICSLLYMLLPNPRSRTLTSEIFTGSTSSCAGSAQSRKAGKLQYHFPPNFHLEGAMLLHLTGAAAIFMTRLMGSTKTSVSLNVTGISLVHSVCWRGTTSTGWHLVTYTVAPFLVIWCPLPNTCIRLYGFSAPARLSSLTCTICRRRSPPSLVLCTLSATWWPSPAGS